MIMSGFNLRKGYNCVCTVSKEKRKQKVNKGKCKKKNGMKSHRKKKGINKQ